MNVLSYSQIEKIILKHIENIDEEIRRRGTRDSNDLTGFYKAKSLALQSLVELKDSKDGRK